jgi:hypothetical protein
MFQALQLADRAGRVDLRRGRASYSARAVALGAFADEAGPKLDLKIGVNDLLTSAQIFGAAEIALDDIDEFPVEVTVVDRGHEREYGNEHREVGHHGGSNCDLTLAHRQPLTQPSSPDFRSVP